MTVPPTKQKILHFMPDNFVWGGIEMYLKELLPILQNSLHYDIVAVVTQDSQLYTMLKEQGVKVYGIPFPLRTHSLWRSMWVNPWGRLVDWSVYPPLIAILKQERPDLVHVHGGRIEQSFIKRAGFPMVYTYHGYGGPYNISGAKNAYLKWLYTTIRPLFARLVPYLSGMTVVSDYERRRLYFEKFLPPEFNAQVLHNGVPTQAMLKLVENDDPRVVREELGIPQDARVISFFCRLREDKNPLAMLRIARRVVESNRCQYPVYFLVAGDGKLSTLFEAVFSEDPILAGKGQYLGFRNDILRLTKACDISLSTSLQEGFGLRVLESLLMGKPCVSYAAGGIPEVMSLPQAQDWLIKNGDEDAFVECLIKTINTSDEELAALAPVLSSHAQTFDVVKHVERLESFYAGVFKILENESAQPKRSKIPMSSSSSQASRHSVPGQAG